MDTDKCPICGLKASVKHIPLHAGSYDVECPRCGRYWIDHREKRIFETADPETKELLPALSAYVRQANRREGEPFKLYENWRDLARAQKDTPITVKVMKLLELAASRSKPGLPVQFNALTDTSLVDAESPQELSFLLEHLIEVGYMRATDNHLKPTMTAKGWEVLQSAASGSGIRGRCFVAMSFSPDLTDAYYEGIYLAIKEDCQMDPRRVDFIEHNEKICDKIVAEIRTCQFLVADVTLHRAGVYFEAGFAMGLARPVIWMCRKDDLANAHFDTRQYSHIVWENPADLRAKLRDRIIATIPK